MPNWTYPPPDHPSPPEIDDATLCKVFGVPTMPLVHGLAPITNDYTAGFHAGLAAAVEWMRAIPHIEMPTHQPDVVSLHDMSAREASMHLERMINEAK